MWFLYCFLSYLATSITIFSLFYNLYKDLIFSKIIEYNVLYDIIYIERRKLEMSKIHRRGSEKMGKMRTITEIAVAEAKKSVDKEILVLIYKMKIEGKTDSEIVASLIETLSK